jgi:DUF917 family protein
MSRILKKQELEDIIAGATFMGAGGGGSPKDGLRLLHELISLNKAEVTLISHQEMADDEWAVMVAEIGAPRAFSGAESFPETVIAFTLMQDVAAQSGKTIKYLMAGELGGFNTMVPLYVAALRGTPFVDADGNGRAVPELATDLYAVRGIAHSPITMASSNGDSLVAYLGDPMDHNAAENIARHVSMAYGMQAAFCTCVVDQKMIVDKLVPGSMTRCMAVGQAFREAGGLRELRKALDDELGVEELFIGNIMDIELKTEGGFDFGITHIDGTKAYAGRSVTIGFKNENMLLRDESGNVMATVPDIVTLVDLEALQPLTNADTKEGQNVAVFGLAAPSSWSTTSRGYECWHHILEKLGYVGDYVPVT